MKVITLHSVSLVACVALIATGSVHVHAVELEPVWQLTVENDTPRVVQNDFADGDIPFPLTRLLIRKEVRPQRRGYYSTYFVSVLRVARDGTIAGESPFVSAAAVPKFYGGHDPRLLVQPRRDAPPYHPDLIRGRGNYGDTTNAWFLAPDGTIAVMVGGDSSAVVDLSTMADIQRLPGEVIDVSFARDSRVFAAIVVINGDDELRSHRLLLTVDPVAGILHEQWVPETVGLLFVSPDCSYAIARSVDTREPTIANDNIVGVDLRTGEVSVLLDNTGGNGYHSDDGTRMLVVQGGWGKMLYFDTADMRKPALLWEYEADAMLTAPAVNDDGSRLAVISTSLAHRERIDIVVLDDAMHEIGRLAKPPGMPMALMFVGNYLFAGTQNDWGIHDVETTRYVRIYRVP